VGSQHVLELVEVEKLFDNLRAESIARASVELQEQGRSEIEPDKEMKVRPTRTVAK
jgi:hypothetical protein